MEQSGQNIIALRCAWAMKQFPSATRASAVATFCSPTAASRMRSAHLQPNPANECTGYRFWFGARACVADSVRLGWFQCLSQVRCMDY